MSPTVRVESFASLEPEWEKLLPGSATNTVFLTPRWQRAWWGEFGQDKELLLLSVREGDRLGIAPLMRQGKTVSFIGDTNICDYMDFITAPGFAAEFFPALLDYLESLDWEHLELHAIPSPSPTLTSFVPLAAGRGFGVETILEGVCPRLDLPTTWEDYLNSLEGKNRHELRRKIRRLSGRSFRYYAADSAGLGQDLDDFLRLHRESDEAKARFMTPDMARFFSAIAAALAEQRQLKVYFLEVAGLRVATAMCFDYGEELLLYNSGYDPDYSSLSVGLLLKAFCIQEAIAAGKRRFDFLRGAEPYKYDLGGKDLPVYLCRVQRARP